jgi:hypothetical protein
MNAEPPEIFGPIAIEGSAIWQNWWFWCAAAVLVALGLFVALRSMRSGRGIEVQPLDHALLRLDALRKQLADGDAAAYKALAALMRDAIRARKGLDVSPMTPVQMEEAIGPQPAIEIVRLCEEAVFSGSIAAAPELAGQAHAAILALFASSPAPQPAEGGLKK